MNTQKVPGYGYSNKLKHAVNMAKCASGPSSDRHRVKRMYQQGHSAGVGNHGRAMRMATSMGVRILSKVQKLLDVEYVEYEDPDMARWQEFIIKC